MSQYNPKFFSREHISSISEALNQVLNGGTNSTHLTEAPETPTTPKREGFGNMGRDAKDVSDLELDNAIRNNMNTDFGGKVRGDDRQSQKYIQARDEKERRAAARVTARVRDSAGKSDADAAAPAPTKRSSSGPTPQSVVPGRGGVPTDAVPYHPVNNQQGSHGEAGGHAYKHGPKRLDVEIPKPLNSSPNTSGVKGVRPHYQPGVPDSVQPSALPFHPLKNPDGDKKKVAGRDYTEGPMSLTNQDNRKKPPQIPMGVEPMRIEESLVEAIRNLIRRNYR